MFSCFNVFMPKIGAHVSAAGGLYNCFDKAKKIGAACLQIFGASPRQWQVLLPSLEAIKEYKKRERASKLGPVFLHGPYLANIGTVENNRLWHGSARALADHLKIADLLGAQGLIFHIGSVKGGGDRKAGIKQVAKGIKQILAAVPGKTQLIMENAAGGGGKLGALPEEIGAIIQLVGDPRVKVCIDTQHAFAAGVLDYTTAGIAAFVKKCDRVFGWKNIVAIHANDSKSEAGSHFDRHENIGEGKIGLEGFVNLSQNKHFASLPWILEVPGFADEGPDKRNVEILKRVCHVS